MTRTTNRRYSSLADLAELYEQMTASPTYARAFSAEIETAQLTIADEPTSAEMPDPAAAELCVQQMIGHLFDLMNDTRLQPIAQRIAWGIVNSFHVVAGQLGREEEIAADKLGELARVSQPGELYAIEIEDQQRLTQSLCEARGAVECMRDHAAEIYRVETGMPFSPLRGSRVSSALTASQIDARDFLAARAKARREQLAPTGPVVVVSGGQDWAEHERLWVRLDTLKERVPSLTVATTAQPKGVDAIAAAWAAARDVPLVAFRLNRAHGNAAPFRRNKSLVALAPVEAIICEGSGIQADLADAMRRAGVPVTIFRKEAKATMQPASPLCSGIGLEVCR